MPVAMNPPSTPRTSSTFFRDIAYEYPAWRSKQPAAWLPRLHGLEIVYRELLHVGRVRKPLVAEPVQARHEPLAHETVERLARLPKIDHAQPPSTGPAEWTIIPSGGLLTISITPWAAS